MIESLLWGLVGAAPLLLGAVLAIVRRWSDRALGLLLGFGAGALMASIAFELWQDGVDSGGALPLTGGVVVGAACNFLADRLVERRAGKSGAGVPLAIGALLDGIPEQLVLGIGLAGGGGVSVALVVAIVVSNLPESTGSSADLLAAGVPRRRVLAVWAGVAALCAATTAVGYAVADVATAELASAVNGFAAGALLVMLVDSMVPEAQRKGRDLTGLATVLGFTVAAWLGLTA